ncbi:MAG: hypothetical protein ACE5FQ_12685 [Thiogranum sp.]
MFQGRGASRRRLDLGNAVPRGTFPDAKGQGMWRYEIAGEQSPELKALLVGLCKTG